MSGSSRCDPARWHSPSRNATSPPSEPTLDEATRDQRIGGAQCRGGDVEDEVMGADGHDLRPISASDPRSS